MSEEEKPKKMTIIASKGTLADGYPPLILAMAARAFDYEVTIFYTFFGLDLIHKKKLKKLKVPAVGNPSMPMPTLLGIIPGATALMTGMMKHMMKKAKVDDYPTMLQKCIDMGVKIVACEMSMNVMGIKKEDIIDGAIIAGAAYYIAEADESDINLYI